MLVRLIKNRKKHRVFYTLLPYYYSNNSKFIKSSQPKKDVPTKAKLLVGREFVFLNLQM